MKINMKILSIPPYISTAWKNIASLHVENQKDVLNLILTLQSGTHIEVPGLEAGIIEEIFHVHAKVVEQEEKPASSKSLLPPSLGPTGESEQIISFGFPFRGPVPESLGGLDSFGTLIEHNPDHAESPELPESIRSKISFLAQTIGVKDAGSIPKPVEKCNCTHCQIARALQAGLTPSLDSSTTETDEIVTDEDLRFKTWEISQTDDKLFIVTNPIDSNERYSVYLGEPVGCTCGDKHCDHIRAVLSS